GQEADGDELFQRNSQCQVPGVNPPRSPGDGFTGSIWDLVQPGGDLAPVVVVEDPIAVIAGLADLVAVDADPHVAVAGLAAEVVLEVAVLGLDLALLEADLHRRAGLEARDLAAHF